MLYTTATVSIFDYLYDALLLELPAYDSALCMMLENDHEPNHNRTPQKEDSTRVNEHGTRDGHIPVVVTHGYSLMMPCLLTAVEAEPLLASMSGRCEVGHTSRRCHIYIVLLLGNYQHWSAS